MGQASQAKQVCALPSALTSFFKSLCVWVVVLFCFLFLCFEKNLLVICPTHKDLMARDLAPEVFIIIYN